MNENLNKLNRGDLIIVSKTKSLIFGIYVEGEYLFDSQHEHLCNGEEACFIQSLNEPTGKRLFILSKYIEIIEDAKRR